MYMCQIETRTQYRGGGVMVSQLELYGGEEGGRGEGVWSCQPKDKPKPGLGDFQ